MKQLIILAIFLAFTQKGLFRSCGETVEYSAVRVAQVHDGAPMNPVVAFFHKSDLALKGNVKRAGDDHFNKEGYLTESSHDTYLHTANYIKLTTGDVEYTYYKNEQGQIEKMTYNGSDDVEYFTYYKSGLLAGSHGVENGIPYRTTYTYDDLGRVTTWHYTYGDDPISKDTYHYETLEDNTLKITIESTNNPQPQVYTYKDGIMRSSSLYGETTHYSYIFDKHGNWTKQSVENGGVTKRVVTYY
ncbi:hypothetical protein AAU57_05625 [Nonlabens sp. YIK11]|uniref:hypothetical protein n=1 Tax=Nonlabens sp. YIK11 TaxID=1453349 RepID=UPI0006DCBF28|nr:hypothetical protein [Nonlabens sp. YIK11]KQC32850.1 hypothetical protein AAU57_05625 [Nonlabens sp. YIK11]